jgi:hypothetical protein
MREINQYGDGLTVLITSSNKPGCDWMCFTSWYSVRQSLPDARVVVACERGNYEMLKWCPRQKVPYFFHSTSQDPRLIALERSLAREPILIMSPETTVHEPLSEDLMSHVKEHGTVWIDAWCLDAKSPDISAFCTIREGCGSFVPSRWIDMGGNPLGYAGRFLKGELTANERRVFTLWQKAAPLYDSIG